MFYFLAPRIAALWDPVFPLLATDTKGQALLAPPGAHHVLGRCRARRIERATQNLAVDGNDALAGLGKARHEALKALPKRFRFVSPEYPGERIMRRQPFGESEKLPKEALFLLGEIPPSSRTRSTQLKLNWPSR